MTAYTAFANVTEKALVRCSTGFTDKRSDKVVHAIHQRAAAATLTEPDQPRLNTQETFHEERKPTAVGIFVCMRISSSPIVALLQRG